MYHGWPAASTNVHATSGAGSFVLFTTTTIPLTGWIYSQHSQLNARVQVQWSLKRLARHETRFCGCRYYELDGSLWRRDAPRYCQAAIGLNREVPGESVHPGGGLSSSVGRSWTIRPSLRTPSPPLARTAKYRSATMKTRTISTGINQKCNIIPNLKLLAQVPRGPRLPASGNH